MINMTNRTNVAMRLRTLKLFLRHPDLFLLNDACLLFNPMRAIRISWSG